MRLFSHVSDIPRLHYVLSPLSLLTTSTGYCRPCSNQT